MLLDEGLVGVTQGRNAADPGAANLSRLFGAFPRTGTTYELFTPEAPFDLPFRKVRFM